MESTGCADRSSHLVTALVYDRKNETNYNSHGEIVDFACSHFSGHVKNKEDPMPLTLKTRRKAMGTYLVYLSGSLDSLTHEILSENIEAILLESPKIIVLDMAQLDYVSSAGIRVVLKTRDALTKKSGKLVFMNLQPQIRKVFDIINALPSMKIFKNIKELDDYLEAMQEKVKSREE